MKFNPTNVLERRSLQRVVYRSSSNKSHNFGPRYRYTTAITILIGATLLWFTFIIYYGTPTFAPSESSFIASLYHDEEPIWIPYQLTPNEVLTGQLTDQSVYTGVYQYTHRFNVSSKSKRSTNSSSIHYRIFFPVDYSGTHNQSTHIGRDYNLDESSSTYLVTHRGDKGHDSPNQDRCIVVEDYHRDRRSAKISNNWFLAALFDGHGDLGHVTSHVAVTDMTLMLLQSMQTHKAKTIATNTSILKMIRNIFHAIDTRGIIAQVPRGGSTALLVLRHRNTMYMASAGDSTAFLIQWLNNATMDSISKLSTKANTLPYTIVESAIHHKPSNPSERQRIEDNGGQVYIPSQDSHESSRVIYKSVDEHGKMIQTGLAMSRSLGDTAAKELRVVISDPDIMTFTLPESNSGNYFVILASDGIMDVTKLDDLIIPIGYALYHARTSSGSTIINALSLSSTCRNIVQQAIETWEYETGNQYRDDMSLVVHKVR